MSVHRSFTPLGHQLEEGGVVRHLCQGGEGQCPRLGIIKQQVDVPFLAIHGHTDPGVTAHGPVREPVPKGLYHLGLEPQPR